MGRYSCCLCLLQNLVFINEIETIEVTVCYSRSVQILVWVQCDDKKCFMSAIDGFLSTSWNGINQRQVCLPWENTSLTLSGLNLKLDWKAFGIRPVDSVQDWAGLSNGYNALNCWEEALEWLQPVQNLYSLHQTLPECNFFDGQQRPILVEQHVLLLWLLIKLYFMFGLYFWTNRRSKRWEPCRWQKLFINFAWN